MYGFLPGTQVWGGGTVSIDIADVPNPLRGLGRRWAVLNFIWKQNRSAGNLNDFQLVETIFV